MMNSEINENYLLSIYDNLQKENLKIMNEIRFKNDDDRSKKLSLLNKEITLINTINANILKLHNLKVQIKKKIDE